MRGAAHDQRRQKQRQGRAADPLSAFRSPLRVQFLPEWDGHRQQFALLAVLEYESDLAGRRFLVPPGFISDGESMPVEGPLTGPQHHGPGVLHDWLYRSHQAPKGVADSVYREALLVMGLDPVWAEERYAAVSFYGKGAYESGPSRLRILPLTGLGSAAQ